MGSLPYNSVYTGPTSTMSLESQFQQTAESLFKEINQTLSNEELKEVYALYKQGSEGDCNTTRPGMLDMKGKAKWDSWNSKKGMAKKEAMEKYVVYAQQLLEKHGKRS